MWSKLSSFCFQIHVPKIKYLQDIVLMEIQKVFNILSKITVLNTTFVSILELFFNPLFWNSLPWNGASVSSVLKVRFNSYRLSMTLLLHPIHQIKKNEHIKSMKTFVSNLNKHYFKKVSATHNLLVQVHPFNSHWSYKCILYFS